MEAPGEREDWVAHFCSITGAGPQDARDYLASTEWDLEGAIAEYYAMQEEGQSETRTPQTIPSEAPYTGPRTLGGDDVPSRPVPSSSSGDPRPPTTQSSKRRFGSLRDFQSEGGGHAHAHGNEDDSDEDQDYYAGGEKSGLAVENPNPGPRRTGADHVRNILEQARRNPPRPGSDDPAVTTSRFAGTGHTLGGDDTPSQAVPDPNASAPRSLPRVERTLHLWRDGFAVDDGELKRYDDPRNAAILDMINQGRAPLHILNVEVGQEVDVKVIPHKDEDYVAPKKKYKPFSGGGQRLGSPTPEVASSSRQQTQPSVTTGVTSSTTSATSASAVDVDESQPTLQLQIRLADGTRLQSRFNTTQRIGDVYSFVDAASPASTQRAYALMTTFPSKELTDRSLVLGDMAEFKRGGVVVQKWQ